MLSQIGKRLRSSAVLMAALVLTGCGTQPANPPSSPIQLAPNQDGSAASAPGSELVPRPPPTDWSFVAAENAPLNAADRQQNLTSAVKATYDYQGGAAGSFVVDLVIGTYATTQDARRYGYAGTTESLGGGFQGAYDNYIVQAANVSGITSYYAVTGQSMSDPPRQYALQIIPLMEELISAIS
jgi:hypothetical protein